MLRTIKREGVSYPSSVTAVQLSGQHWSLLLPKLIIGSATSVWQ